MYGWLTQMGKKQAVKLEKKTNFFQALVKPEKPGRCNIVANDLKTEVKDGTKSDSIGIMYKPMFYARTQFLSFEAGRVSEKEAEITDILDLDIIPITSHLDPANGTISPDVGDEVVFRCSLRDSRWRRLIHLLIHRLAG